MERSIYDVLPNHIIERLLIGSCDIKTVLKFKATSMAGNEMYTDIKERVADKITERVFEQLLTNITDYHALLTDGQTMFVLMKPFIQKFASILLEHCLQDAIQSSNNTYHNVLEIITDMKTRTQLNKKSLIQVLWSLENDTSLPDNLREKRDMCLEILKEYYCSITGMWSISFDSYKMNIYRSKWGGKIEIKTSDIEKVTKCDTFKIYPSVFKSNVTCVQFQFTKENIPDIVRLFQVLYGRYTFVNKDTIDVNLHVRFSNALQNDIMNDFQKTHFNSVIKI